MPIFEISPNTEIELFTISDLQKILIGKYGIYLYELLFLLCSYKN